MPRTAAQKRGIQRERDLRKRLEAIGYPYQWEATDPPGLTERWWVSRASGSLGDADLIASNWRRRPMLIEVKSTITPFSGFGPADRADLIAAGKLAGFDVWLCWWPKNGRPTWIHPALWPKLAATRPTT